MTHKIIKVDNYLLVVDDSEIKVGDYFYSIREIVEQAVIDYPKNEHHGVIIAHLPLNGSPILEGVDLLPPYFRHQEDGVEKYAQSCNQLYKEWLVTGYKSGYNKAREKYKYTEEDVIRIVDKSRETGLTAEYLMLSLQYPTEFECEMENYCGSPLTTERCPKCIDSCDRAYQKPKTITTAQGVQWVGKYK